MANISISLDRYRIFHTVAHAGSLTEAADTLYVSQPAVSQAIKKLEHDLDTSLFRRTARGVQLTPGGEVLLSYVDQAIQLMEAGERHVADLKRLNRGDIRIGASDTLCRYYLLPVLEQFNREYPHVQLHVTNRTSRETVDLLKFGTIDFGVVNLPVPVNSRLTVYEGPLLHDCFVVGERYRDWSTKVRTLDELSTMPLLLLEKDSVTRSQMDEFFLANGLSLTPEIELGSIDLLIEFARIGLGVAAVAKDFVRHDLASERLFEVQTDPEPPARAIGLITSTTVPLSHAAEVLLERLRHLQ